MMSQEHQLLIAVQIASGAIAFAMSRKPEIVFSPMAVMFSLGWTTVELVLLFAGTDYMTWQLWLFALIGVIGSFRVLARFGTSVKNNLEHPVLAFFFVVVYVGFLISLIVSGQPDGVYNPA